MFEDMTYEKILESVLSRVTSQVDKRQGSVIYDAVAPACAELAEAYIKMDNVLNNSFADTACREYLILRAKERGIVPYEASYAVARGVFDVEIPIGTRFSIGTVNFAVSEKISDYEYEMICETAGEIGNKYFGTLIPIGYVSGMSVANLTEILIPGRDEEDTESFRKRYFENLYGDTFGGNKADYKKWVKAIDGVGQVRVSRVNEDSSNVRVIIWGAYNTEPSQQLINRVKEALDPADSTGYGNGIAPLGHCVSVEGAERHYIVVNIYAQFDDDADKGYIEETADSIIYDYFVELNENWENTENGLELYTAQILVRLLDIKGIKNIEKIEISGQNYIKLAENQMLEYDYLEFK